MKHSKQEASQRQRVPSVLAKARGASPRKASSQTPLSKNSAKISVKSWGTLTRGGGRGAGRGNGTRGMGRSVHQSRKDRSHASAVKNISGSRSSSIDSNQGTLVGTSGRTTKTRSGSKLFSCEDSKQKSKSVRKKSIKDEKMQKERVSALKESPHNPDIDKSVNNTSVTDVDAVPALESDKHMEFEQHIMASEKCDQKFDAKTSGADCFPSLDQDHNYFAFPAIQSSDGGEVNEPCQADHITEYTGDSVSSAGVQPISVDENVANSDDPEETVKVQPETCDGQLSVDTLNKETEQGSEQSVVREENAKLVAETPTDAKEKDVHGEDLSQTANLQLDANSENANKCLPVGEKQLEEAEDKNISVAESLGESDEAVKTDSCAVEEIPSQAEVVSEDGSSKSGLASMTPAGPKRGRGRPRKQSPASEGIMQQSEQLAQKTPASVGRGRRKSSLLDAPLRNVTTIAVTTEVTQNKCENEVSMLDQAEGLSKAAEPESHGSQSKHGVVPLATAVKPRIKTRRSSSTILSGEHSETESVGSVLAKDRLSSDDGPLKLGQVEGSSSQDLSGQCQGDEDIVGEKTDLDSSGSSQSLMDIFKHTIALRQQLAKERQKWQKPEDEEASATSSVDSSFKSAFEALKKGDPLLDGEGLLVGPEQQLDEGFQVLNKSRRGSKDLRIDQGPLVCRPASETKEPACPSNRRASDDMKTANMVRGASAEEEEKTESRPHSRRSSSSVLASPTELIADDIDDTAAVGCEQQSSDVATVKKGPGKPPKKVCNTTSVPVQPSQESENIQTRVPHRRKRSRRGLHLKKMYRSVTLPESEMNSLTAADESASNVASVEDTTSVSGDEKPKVKLTRSECLMRARMCRGRKRWSRGELTRAPSAAFGHNPEEDVPMSEPVVSDEEQKVMKGNADANGRETLDEHSYTKLQDDIDDGTGIKESTELQPSDDVQGPKGNVQPVTESDVMPSDSYPTGSEEVKDEIKTEGLLESGEDKAAVIGENVAEKESSSIDCMSCDDLTKISQSGLKNVVKPDEGVQTGKPEDSTSEVTKQKKISTHMTESLDGDEARFITESKVGENGCPSSVDGSKVIRKKQNRMKRRSELDLLNDVDGSISRRKKSKVYQKAYELYGEKGLLDNALAKTLLGLGKFDAENMSRSRLVEELAQKRGSTDLLSDSSLKVMTRRKQNRYSYLFRKKRRDSRPGSPGGSRNAASSRCVLDSPKAPTQSLSSDNFTSTELETKISEIQDPESKPVAMECVPVEKGLNSSTDCKCPETGAELATMKKECSDAVVTTSSGNISTPPTSSDPATTVKTTKRKKMKPSRPIKRLVDYSKLSGSIEYMVRYCKPCSIQLIDLIKCLDALKKRQSSISEEEHSTGTVPSDDGSSAVLGMRGRKRKVHAKKSLPSAQLDMKHDESPTLKNRPTASSPNLDENVMTFLQNSSADLLSGGRKVEKETTAGVVSGECVGSEGDRTKPSDSATPCNSATVTETSSPRRSQRATMKSRYRCLFCKYTCHIRKIMEDHVYNHMNIIPYMCGLCYSIFSTRGGVRVHNRRCHPRHQPVIIKKAEVDETQYYTTVEEFFDKYGDVSSVLPIPTDDCSNSSAKSRHSAKEDDQPNDGQKAKKSARSIKSIAEHTATSGSRPQTSMAVIETVDNKASTPTNTCITPELARSAVAVIVAPRDSQLLESQATGMHTSPSRRLALPVLAVSGMSNSQLPAADSAPQTKFTGALVAGNKAAEGGISEANNARSPSETSQISVDTTEMSAALPPKRSPIILRIPKIHQWKKDYSESSDDAGSSGESEARTMDESQSDGENVGATSDQSSNQVSWMDARQAENVVQDEMKTKDEETEAVEADDEASSPMLKIVSVCSLAGKTDPVPMEQTDAKDNQETAPTTAELLENLNTMISTQHSVTDGSLEVDEVWQCLMCDDNTRLYDVMVEHIHRVHKETYWYACPYCPFGCSQPRFNMYRHMRRTHPQKADNIFVGIIDSDRYFVKKKVGVNVIGTLESADPGLLHNVKIQLPDCGTVWGKKSAAQSSGDKTETSEAASSSDAAVKAKVKQDEEPIFTRSESGKKSLKPTAHVAPAVQNKTPVREHVWSESPRGATVPVYIAENPTGASVNSASGSDGHVTRCKDVSIDEDGGCSIGRNDQSKRLADGQMGSSSLAATVVMTSSAYTAADEATNVIASGGGTSKVQPTLSSLATSVVVEPQAMPKVKPPPLIPLGVVEASQLGGHQQMVPPLQRAPSGAVAPQVIPQPAHQGSPHIVPLHSQVIGGRPRSPLAMSTPSSASATVSAHIRPSSGGPPRPVNTTLPIRSAEVQPVSIGAATKPRPAAVIGLSEEEEARRAFSVFNIGARMRQPKVGGVRTPTFQPPRAHTTPVVRPMVAPSRPAARSPPTTDLEQFKQFQLPPRPRMSLPVPPPPPPYGAHIPATAPPPYGARHMTAAVRQLPPPVAHGGVIRTMPPRLSAAPEQPPAILPIHQRSSLSGSVVCQPTAAPRQPSVVPRPAHLNHVSHWTCPYCPVPNLMTSKTLVEKHIRNCHPEHQVVYVPHNM
ncbi:hypothetical protein LSH36_48g07033 [Paralvinella palmiformis]|uniref:C2H2-type domain-containing protein n=1 Tax=Paralvinella palmiformis TaxID=53620 RepID=A0AAD9ND34_9ANNE|nr:hypothetical protein LSH36_48g07033 [Paralvinella palmiformis]